MENIIDLIAKELVDHPERIEITTAEDDDVIILTLRVDSSDMGKVIGKQGRIAKAFRTVLKAIAMNKNKQVHLEIRENEKVD